MTSDDPWWSNYLNDVRDTKHIPERSNGYKRFGYTQTTSVHSTRISDKKKAVTRYARRGGGTAEKVQLFAKTLATALVEKKKLRDHEK